MNKEIAHILKERLASNGGLPFVEVLAGLAQTVEYKQENSDGNPITKRMPVGYDATTPEGCTVSPERALIPDSTRKGILYFEDLGATFIDRVSGGHMRYRSTLVLVCWMNRALLVGDHYAEITSHCVTTILGKLNIRRPKNEPPFSRMAVTPGRILQQNASVFSRYTYDETVTLYLRPPYEFFGMELTVDYCIHPDCLTTLEYKDPVCY